MPAGSTYEIHYLEAPLFKSKFGDTLAQFNAYHGGLLFVNKYAKPFRFIPLPLHTLIYVGITISRFTEMTPVIFMSASFVPLIL